MLKSSGRYSKMLLSSGKRDPFIPLLLIGLLYPGGYRSSHSATAPLFFQ